MENKKKPSKLYFIPDHYDFNKPGTLFEPKMLDWPIFTEFERSEITNGKLIETYRTAFEALTMISPFLAKVSMRVNLQEKRLFMAHRTWGEIYLNDLFVLEFRHDTRVGNLAFHSLLEWPEINPRKQGEADKEWEKVKETLFSWTVEQWTDFFFQRIKARSQFLMTKALNMKKEAMDLEESALKVLYAII